MHILFNVCHTENLPTEIDKLNRKKKKLKYTRLKIKQLTKQMDCFYVMLISKREIYPCVENLQNEYRGILEILETGIITNTDSVQRVMDCVLEMPAIWGIEKGLELGIQAHKNQNATAKILTNTLISMYMKRRAMRKVEEIKSTIQQGEYEILNVIQEFEELESQVMATSEAPKVVVLFTQLVSIASKHGWRISRETLKHCDDILQPQKQYPMVGFLIHFC